MMPHHGFKYFFLLSSLLASLPLSVDGGWKTFQFERMFHYSVAHALENECGTETCRQSSITFMQLFSIWIIASVTLSAWYFCFEELCSGRGLKIREKKTEKGKFRGETLKDVCG